MNELKTWARALTADVHEKWKTLKGTQDFFEAGYAVFYSPVKHEPDLLIVGYNPGGGRSSFDASKASSVPEAHDYFVSKYEMATAMKSLFQELEYERLLRDSVKINYLFFRSPRKAHFDALERAMRDELIQFCEKKVVEIIRTLEPKTILCEGIGTYDILKTSLRLREHDRAVIPGAQRVFVECVGANPRLIGIIHPTGGHATTEDTLAMKAALKEYLQSHFHP